MEDVGSWVRHSYLVSSQDEFEAKLTKLEEFMRSFVQSNNSDRFGETMVRLAGFIQWNPSFEVPDSFIGQ